MRIPMLFVGIDLDIALSFPILMVMNIKDLNKTDRRQDYANVVFGFLSRDAGYLKGKHLLDFGSGKKMIFTKKLRALGLTVDAYDCGDNVTEEHVTEIKGYDLVFAANVINVPASVEDLHATIKQIVSAINPKGSFLFNYPSSPRKAGLSVAQILEVMAQYFLITQRVKCSTPLFRCSRAYSA